MWVKTGRMGTPPSVVRVDATTGAVLATIPLRGQAPRMAFGVGSTIDLVVSGGVNLTRVDAAR